MRYSASGGDGHDFGERGTRGRAPRIRCAFTSDAGRGSLDEQLNGLFGAHFLTCSGRHCHRRRGGVWVGRRSAVHDGSHPQGCRSGRAIGWNGRSIDHRRLGFDGNRRRSHRRCAHSAALHDRWGLYRSRDLRLERVRLVTGYGRWRRRPRRERRRQWFHGRQNRHRRQDRRCAGGYWRKHQRRCARFRRIVHGRHDARRWTSRSGRYLRHGWRARHRRKRHGRSSSMRRRFRELLGANRLLWLSVALGVHQHRKSVPHVHALLRVQQRLLDGMLCDAAW